MIDWALQSSIGLTQLLALVAIIAAIVLWQLSALETLFKQIRVLLTCQQQGWIDKRARRVLRMLVAESLLLLLGIAGGIIVFHFTHHYLFLTSDLTERSSGLDLAVFNRLRSHAEDTKLAGLAVGFLTLGFLGFGWGIRLFRESLHGSEITATQPHPFIISEEWKTSPAALWDYRLREMMSDGGLLLGDSVGNASYTDGSWRGTWTSWAAVAAGTQVASLNRLHQQAPPLQGACPEVAKSADVAG